MCSGIYNYIKIYISTSIHVPLPGRQVYSFEETRLWVNPERSVYVDTTEAEPGNHGGAEEFADGNYELLWFYYDLLWITVKQEWWNQVFGNVYDELLWFIISHYVLPKLVGNCGHVLIIYSN